MRLDHSKLCYYFRAMDENIGTMLAQVSRLLRRSFDERARGIGVTRPQWQVLSLVSFNGGINQGFGTARKDNVVSPGLFNWNLAMFKSIPFSGKENPHLELRVETFNTFNHTQFNGVDTGFTDGNFGQVTSTFDPRELQFGAKIVF